MTTVLHMTPCAPFGNLPYQAEGHIVGNGQRFERFASVAASADFADGILGQLSAAVRFAAHMCVWVQPRTAAVATRTAFGARVRAVAESARRSPLCIAVCNVLCVRAEPQMGRIDTQPIVTTGAIVADAITLGNWPDTQLIGEAMGAMGNGAIAVPDGEPTIATPVLRASPKPTLPTLIHAGPEGGNRVLAGILSGHSSRSLLALRGATLRAIAVAPGLSAASNYSMGRR